MEENPKVIIKHQDFDRVLQDFMCFLREQDKIETSDDLIQNMQYTYMTCSKGINTCRCILQKTQNGSRLNIEYRLYQEEKTYVKILTQKEGEYLANIDSWIFEEEEDITQQDDRG